MITVKDKADISHSHPQLVKIYLITVKKTS